jgi:hypothetical protein
LKKRKRSTEEIVIKEGESFYWDNKGAFCFGDPKSSTRSATIIISNNSIYEDDNLLAGPDN